MKFVSIDSSLANTGVAVGTIGPTSSPTITIKSISLTETVKSKNKQIRASSDAIARCRQTHEFVSEIINRERPGVVFIETPSGSQSSSGMTSYGATCMLIASLTPPPIEVTPNEVKMGSVGKKTASKKEMIDWAHGLYPNIQWDKNKDGSLKNKNEHMADAIAIAHAAVKTDVFKRIQTMFNS
jgi:Holliday junction resolvasome RuvABC endonuclease subunit